MTEITFNPYYRKSRRSVVIEVYLERTVAKTLSTGIKIEEHQWDERTRKIVRHPNASLLNAKIRNRIAELEKDVTHADLLGVNLTRDRVKRISEGHAVTTDVYKWGGEWLKQRYREGSKTYKSHLNELEKIHRFSPTLSFGDIDKSFIIRYRRHILETLGQHHNTLWKAERFLNTLLGDAVEARLLEEKPFTRQFPRTKYVEGDAHALNMEELDRVEQILEGDHTVMLKIVAAQFLFMCYTGMRISDLQSYSREEHLIDGERIIKETVKEKTILNLPLHDRLIRIIKVLDELPRKKMADQTLNKWLKILQAVAKIDRIVLTNHVGRHTWGYYLAEHGFSLEEVQRLMAHADIKSSKRYFHLEQPRLDRAVQSKLNNRPKEL